MKLIAPDYYADFTCIADRCRHSCCIGWEIDIDAQTLEKYRNISGDFGKRLQEGMVEENGCVCFCLSEEERCPFLNEKGLCDIILTLGEDYLSQICTDHPRFCAFYSDRTEIGFGLCCEEAARIVLSKKTKMKLVVFEDDGDDEEMTLEEAQFFALRGKLLDIAQNREKSIDDRMTELLSFVNKNIPEKSFSEWADVFFSLERMDTTWSELLISAKHSAFEINMSDSFETEFEQLLVYFLYRHISDAELSDEQIASRVAFAVLGVRFISALFCLRDTKERSLIEICRLYSSEVEYSEENTERLLSLI